MSNEINLAQFVNKLVRVIEPRHGKVIRSCESIIVALDNIIRDASNIDLPILTVINFHPDFPTRIRSFIIVVFIVIIIWCSTLMILFWKWHERDNSVVYEREIDPFKPNAIK